MNGLHASYKCLTDSVKMKHKKNFKIIIIIKKNEMKFKE